MPVKIRLARRGRKKRPYYHIVVADARAPRDGKFIENIGFYNPMTVPATIDLDRDKAFEWLDKGAQPTDTARAILKFKGVFYKRHLLRGVKKGAFTEEKALEMYQEWIDLKEAKVAARFEETRLKKEEFWKMLSGEIKPPKKKAPVEAAEAFRETEASDEVVETPNAEATETSTEEAVTEEVATTEETVSEVETATKEVTVEETPAEEVVADAETTVEEIPAEEVVADAETAVEETPAEEVVADTETTVEEATPEKTAAGDEIVSEDAPSEETSELDNTTEEPQEVE